MAADDRALAADFAEFWRVYPHRVGKLRAQQAYAKARQRASAREILAGVERYTAMKPAWQQWAHPSSWLNAGRWLDEYAPEPEPADRRVPRWAR
ncbi:MAG TPA: hypothetical protein VNL98_07085 [Gemmatimonadales bacterium]|nr:hypothetical protein [Gemmatimonadales bacterium]